MIFTASGVLHYSDNPIKLTVEIDPGIADFYYHSIPKHLGVQKPMFEGHISVVRNYPPPHMEFWNKYNGQIIEFNYENWVYNNELYYWLNTWSSDLEKIRSELGLPPYGDVSESPDRRHRFHITLGNLKNKKG